QVARQHWLGDELAARVLGSMGDDWKTLRQIRSSLLGKSASTATIYNVVRAAAKADQVERDPPLGTNISRLNPNRRKVRWRTDALIPPATSAVIGGDGAALVPPRVADAIVSVQLPVVSAVYAGHTEKPYQAGHPGEETSRAYQKYCYDEYIIQGRSLTDV